MKAGESKEEQSSQDEDEGDIVDRDVGSLNNVVNNVVKVLRMRKWNVWDIVWSARCSGLLS
jgi:hypothetical protein